jgi:hypothetical protein
MFGAVIAALAVATGFGAQGSLVTIRTIPMPGAEAIVGDASKGVLYALRFNEGRRDLFLYDRRGVGVLWAKGPISSHLVGTDDEGTPVVIYSAGSVALGPRGKRSPVPAIVDATQHLQQGVLVGTNGGSSVLVRWTEPRGPEWTRDRVRTQILDAPPGRGIGDVAVAPSKRGVAVVALGESPGLVLFPLVGGRPPLRELALHYWDGRPVPRLEHLTLLDDSTAVAFVDALPAQGPASARGGPVAKRLCKVSLSTGEVEDLGEFVVPPSSNAIARVDERGAFAVLSIEVRYDRKSKFLVPQTRRVVKVFRLGSEGAKGKAATTTW